ncbi:helix-turn-helix domain-containing protein [Streptoalloteichus hindustanus]|uniref:Helix-turn-helix n=1 Tax=Streptoalloteichus hindustanus TaxID=2017 RepID=A0A1M5F0W5_STRHI|nr:Helix-turn-helix [Streptoalloteichus hindustanus]
MAERTNYSKPYLGQLETGKRAVLPQHVAAYERALGVDLDRIAFAASAPRRVDGASLASLATILSSTRRLEDVVGVGGVLDTVRGVHQLSQVLAREARAALEAPAVRLASEISQYRGWLELAAGDQSRAARCLGTAVELARQADDPDRLAHGLSFTAYSALEAGRVKDAAALIDEALRDGRVHPLIRMYDRYQLARVHAAAGESYAAQRALIVADKAAEEAVAEEPPDAGYWYTDGLWGLYRGRVLWLLGQQNSARQEVQAGLAAMPREHREAGWAAKWVRAVQGGDVPH